MTTKTHDQLRPSAHNPRTDITAVSVRDLSASIIQRGLLQAIRCRPDGEIISGERRWTAIGLAIEEGVLPKTYAIPVMVVDEDQGDEVNEIEDRIDQIVENLQRVELNPVDEAFAYEQLTGFQVTPQQIADQVGVSKAHVLKRLALLRLSTEALEWVRAGNCTIEKALLVASIKDGDRHATLIKLGEGVVKDAIADQKDRAAVDTLAKKMAKLGVEVQTTTNRQVGALPTPPTGKTWTVIKEVGATGDNGWDGSIPSKARHASIHVDWAHNLVIRFYRYEKLEEGHKLGHNNLGQQRDYGTTTTAPTSNGSQADRQAEIERHELERQRRDHVAKEERRAMWALVGTLRKSDLADLLVLCALANLGDYVDIDEMAPHLSAPLEDLAERGEHATLEPYNATDRTKLAIGYLVNDALNYRGGVLYEELLTRSGFDAEATAKSYDPSAVPDDEVHEFASEAGPEEEPGDDDQGEDELDPEAE